MINRVGALPEVICYMRTCVEYAYMRDHTTSIATHHEHCKCLLYSGLPTIEDAL